MYGAAAIIICWNGAATLLPYGVKKQFSRPYTSRRLFTGYRRRAAKTPHRCLIAPRPKPHRASITVTGSAITAEKAATNWIWKAALFTEPPAAATTLRNTHGCCGHGRQCSNSIYLSGSGSIQALLFHINRQVCYGWLPDTKTTRLLYLKNRVKLVPRLCKFGKPAFKVSYVFIAKLRPYGFNFVLHINCFTGSIR
jgi:hypothetical protein